MAGVYVVAFLLFMISMHTFSQNIHALQNSPAPTPSMCSPDKKILTIGVPRKTAFFEFVSIVENGRNLSYGQNGKILSYGGFCVKVFEEVMNTLNYSFNYIAVGDGVTEPNYDDLIGNITKKEFDAVVGDVTITANRYKEVLFTQPFIDSGLLVAVRLNKDRITSGFAFLKPFTPRMWVLTIGFFITGGLAIYLLERQKHPQLKGSKPSRRCGIALWLGFSSLFTNQTDDIKTVLGRLVVIAWLFVAGTLYSCYTANLSAILAAPRLEPAFNDINSVLARNDIKIGFQKGSFAEKYLTDLADTSRIDQSRLKPLNTKDEYYTSLSNGEVGAIIDEQPYMLSVMNNHCNNIIFLGQTFTTNNWGFAFDPCYDELVKDISKKILNLSDDGTVNMLLKEFFPNYDNACNGYSPSGSSQLDVYNIWGLFVMSGLVIIMVLLLYMVRQKWKASIIRRHSPRQASSSHGGGLKLTKRVQFPRRTKSLTPSEPRTIIIAPAQVTVVLKDSRNQRGSRSI